MICEIVVEVIKINQSVTKYTEYSSYCTTMDTCTGRCDRERRGVMEFRTMHKNFSAQCDALRIWLFSENLEHQQERQKNSWRERIKT